MLHADGDVEDACHREDSKARDHQAYGEAEVDESPTPRLPKPRVTQDHAVADRARDRREQAADQNEGSDQPDSSGDVFREQAICPGMADQPTGKHEEADQEEEIQGAGDTAEHSKAKAWMGIARCYLAGVRLDPGVNADHTFVWWAWFRRRMQDPNLVTPRHRQEFLSIVDVSRNDRLSTVGKQACAVLSLAPEADSPHRWQNLRALRPGRSCSHVADGPRPRLETDAAVEPARHRITVVAARVDVPV